MTLPHPENLVVEIGKLADYLLSPTSPRGRHKAAFFRQFGYTIENVAEFAEALREHGRCQQVIRVIDSPYGARYYVEGLLRSPSGRKPRVRTVWQLEPDLPGPRLLTAFPIRR